MYSRVRNCLLFQVCRLRMRMIRWWWIPLVCFFTVPFVVVLGIGLGYRTGAPAGNSPATSFQPLDLNDATGVSTFRRLAYAPSNNYTEFVVKRINATFQGLQLEPFATLQLLKKKLEAPHKALGQDLAAILFSSDADVKRLEYTFRLAPLPKDATSRTDKVRSSWSHPGPRPMLYREKEELPLLVSSIFRAHLDYWGYIAPPIFLQRFPFPEHPIDSAFFEIVHWIPLVVVASPVVFVACFVCIATEERKMHRYLRVIGLGIHDRIACFVGQFLTFFAWACLFTTLLHVKIYRSRAAVLEATPWTVTMPLLLILAVQTTLLTLCVTSLIRKRVWRLVVVSFIWAITCVLPAVLFKTHDRVDYRNKMWSSALLPNIGAFWAFRAIAASEATGMGLTMTSPMDVTLCEYVGLLIVPCLLFICCSSCLWLVYWLRGRWRGFKYCWEKTRQLLKDVKCWNVSKAACYPFGWGNCTQNLESSTPLIDAQNSPDETAEPKSSTRYLLVLHDATEKCSEGDLHDRDLRVAAGKITVVLCNDTYEEREVYEVILGLKMSQKEISIQRRYRSIGLQLEDDDFLRSSRVGDVLDLFARLRGCPMGEQENTESTESEDTPTVQVSSMSQDSSSQGGGGSTSQPLTAVRAALQQLHLKEEQVVKTPCERSRLRVAIAAVGSPELIVLKDPTADMDASEREATWEYLRQLRAAKCSILLVTSSPAEAECVGDTLFFRAAGTFKFCEADQKTRQGLVYELYARKGPKWDAAMMRDILPEAGLEFSTSVFHRIVGPVPGTIRDISKRLYDLERNKHVSDVKWRVGRSCHQLTSSGEADTTCTENPPDLPHLEVYDMERLERMQLFAMFRKPGFTWRRFSFTFAVYIFSIILAFCLPVMLQKSFGFTRFGYLDGFRPVLTYAAPRHSAILSSPSGDHFLESYFNESVNVANISAKVLEGGLEGYADRYEIGVETKADGILAWYNGALLHTSMASLVAVQDAILKNVTQHQTAAVIASNHPLKDSMLYARALSAADHRYGAGVFLCLGLALLACIPVNHVAKEISSRFYRLQLLSGLRPGRYWAGTFLRDALLGSIGAVLFTVIEVACDLIGGIGDISSPKCWSALFFLLSIHSLSVLPLVYAVSSVSKFPFGIVFLGGSIVGCCSIWLAVLVQTASIQNGSLGDHSALWAMRFLVPFSAAPWGATDLRLAGAFRRQCSVYVTLEDACDAADKRCCEWTCYNDNGECKTMGPWSVTPGGIGDEIIALLLILPVSYALFFFRVCSTSAFRSTSTVRNESYSSVAEVNAIFDKWTEDVPLQAIHFSVKRSDRLGIIDFSGSSKTTLARMIVGDLDSSNGKSTAIRNVGFCPHEDWIPEHLSAQEVLRCFAKIRGVKNSNEYCKRWLDLIDVKGESICGDTKTIKPGSLRLLSVCCALVGNPKVSVLDDPCARMNKSDVSRLRYILKNCKEDVAIVLTSPSIYDGLEYCSRVILLDDGSIRELPREVEGDGQGRLPSQDSGRKQSLHEGVSQSASSSHHEAIEHHSGQHPMFEDSTVATHSLRALESLNVGINKMTEMKQY